MTSSNVALTLLNQPSQWTSAGREISRNQRGMQVAAQNAVMNAEFAEFEAQIRKRYIENRMLDAKDVMQLALNQSGGDPLLLAGLMEFAGEWMRTEQRIYRNANASFVL